MLDKENDLKDLKFLCPSSNQQKIEHLDFSDIKNHIENCEFLNQNICIQCGTAGSETELMNHIKQCQEAIILCEYCNEETERKFYDDHLNNCEKINHINLDSSILEESLEDKIECDYVKLTETKIDNLFNNEFVVSKEKEENICNKKSEINHENQFESKKFFL